MGNGIIYYSGGLKNITLLKGVQDQIKKSNLPIVSCTLSSVDFGENVVVDLPKGPIAYFTQILTALTHSKEDNVFFCEHDVLYHPSHFDYTPSTDDSFYYNSNVWKWNPNSNDIFTYTGYCPVSGICVNRRFAVDFYKKRLDLIYERGYDKIETRGNPLWARKMGYEPDKKKREWKSEHPNIDIKHNENMTIHQLSLNEFVKKPEGWVKSNIDLLPGWENPKELIK